MKNRKMLNDWNAFYIQDLVKQIETQSKVTLANWAVDYAESRILPIWDEYFPADQRPANAISAARDWLRGEIKFPQAKVSILECHDAARSVVGSPAAEAAARAIGQAASTIHSAKHCIGLPLYGALAVAYDALGFNAEWASLEQEAAKECKKMLDKLIDVSVNGESNPAKIVWHC
ncbi:MAG: hypothetical protein JXR38_04360 [Bacilli bacterium]|nr:hypothetical protein [Bacilli bacterium]